MKFTGEFEGMTTKKDGTRILKFSTEAPIDTDELVGGVFIDVTSTQLHLDPATGEVS